MIEEHLDFLISMGVSNAFNCLMEVLRRFVTECKKITKRRKLNVWVKSLDDNSQKTYHQYKPDRFLIWKFTGEVSNTIYHSNYERRPVSNPNQTLDGNFSVEDFNNQLVKYALEKENPFADGLSYLGQLTGAWVLTCPENQIREDKFCRKLIDDYQEGKIGSPYLEHIRGSTGRVSLRSASDIELIFALDYMIYEYTDLWIN